MGRVLHLTADPLVNTEDYHQESTSTAVPREATPELIALIYRQMLSLCGPGQDIDDLVQNALFQVLRSEFNGRSKLSTFTHTICYRVWLRHLSWSTRFRSLFHLADAPPELPQENGNALEQLQERERHARLYSALDRVSAKRRAIVVLHDIDELEISEIAEVVNAPPATVRSRLRDGRRQLAALLSSDPYFGNREFSQP